ncbi:hypothetical protein ABZ078_29555 [Streptomyces sp. NPDC006385]|uniref:hypothetical protein n=1 Tax=Streptomyces sp. NPDC006385 TaxID=3156761 RepID=UPI0033B0F129
MGWRFAVDEDGWRKATRFAANGYQIGGAVGLAALVTLAAATAGTAASYRTVFVALAAVCTTVAALAFALPGPRRRGAAAAPGRR